MRALGPILAASVALLVVLAAQGAHGCSVRRALLQGEPSLPLQVLYKLQFACIEGASMTREGDPRALQRSRQRARSASAANGHPLAQDLPRTPQGMHPACKATLQTPQSLHGNLAPCSFLCRGCEIQSQYFRLAAPTGLKAVDLKNCPAVESGSTAPPPGSRELWTAPSESVYVAEAAAPDSMRQKPAQASHAGLQPDAQRLRLRLLYSCSCAPGPPPPTHPSLCLQSTVPGD